MAINNNNYDSAFNNEFFLMGNTKSIFEYSIIYTVDYTTYTIHYFLSSTAFKFLKFFNMVQTRSLLLATTTLKIFLFPSTIPIWT